VQQVGSLPSACTVLAEELIHRMSPFSELQISLLRVTDRYWRFLSATQAGDQRLASAMFPWRQGPCALRISGPSRTSAVREGPIGSRAKEASAGAVMLDIGGDDNHGEASWDRKRRVAFKIDSLKTTIRSAARRRCRPSHYLRRLPACGNRRSSRFYR